MTVWDRCRVYPEYLLGAVAVVLIMVLALVLVLVLAVVVAAVEEVAAKEGARLPELLLWLLILAGMKGRIITIAGGMYMLLGGTKV